MTAMANPARTAANPVRAILRAKARMLLGRWVGRRGPGPSGGAGQPLDPSVMVVIAGLGLALAAAVFALGRALFRALLVLSPALGAGTLAGITTGLGLVLLLSTTAASFSAFYAASDLGLLLVWPLSGRQVAVIKAIEVAAGEVAILLVLAIPLLAGYGAAAGAPGWFYVALPLLGVVFGLLPTGLALLLNLLAMRLIPAHRAREVGLAVGALLGAGVYAATQLLMASMENLSAAEAGQVAARLAPAYLPTAWFSSGVAAAAAGDVLRAAGWTALYVLASGVALAVALAVAPRLYAAGDAGRSRRHGPARHAPPRTDGHAPPRPARPVGVASPVLALARKELRVVLRDAAEWTQALYGLIVILVLIVTRQMGSGAGGEGDSAGLSPTLVLVFALAFTLMGFGSVVGLGAVAREGRARWLPLTAPLGPADWFGSKILGLLALSGPVVLLAAVLLGWLAGGLDPGGVVLVTATAAVALPGAAAISVYVGALSPDFEATEPRRRVTGSAGITHFVLELGYLGAISAVFAAANALAGGGPGPAALVALAGLAGVALLSWLTVRACLSRADRLIDSWR